jgi:hypothetical protein
MDVADPEAIVPSGSVKHPVEERALSARNTAVAEGCPATA